jgi:hypothetical protein
MFNFRRKPGITTAQELAERLVQLAQLTDRVKVAVPGWQATSLARQISAMDQLLVQANEGLAQSDSAGETEQQLLDQLRSVAKDTAQALSSASGAVQANTGEIEAELLARAGQVAGVENRVEKAREEYFRQAWPQLTWPLARGWVAMRFKAEVAAKTEQPGKKRWTRLFNAVENTGGASTNEQADSPEMDAAEEAEAKQLDAVYKRLVKANTAVLPTPWANKVNAELDATYPDLVRELKAVLNTPGQRHLPAPHWWKWAKTWQWTLYIIMLAGLIWWGMNALLERLLLPTLPMPHIGVMPLAVVALLIGLILGLIATWVNYRLVKAGAYRRARNLKSYLNSRVEDVLQAKLYARLESHIAEHVSLMALANALAE